MFNVLIADDEPLVRISLKSLVDWESHGISMDLEAENGKSALELIRNNPDTDLLITDINMPVMDGLELIDKVRSLYPDLPVIVLSGYDDYSLVRRAFTGGIRDYILKSEMEPDEVLKLIKFIETEKDSSRQGSLDSGYQTKPRKETLLKWILGLSDRTHEVPGVNETEMLRLTDRNLVVLSARVDDYRTIQEKFRENTLNRFSDSIGNSIKQVLSRLPYGEILIAGPDDYILLLSFPYLEPSKIDAYLVDILANIRHLVKTYVNTSLTFGISGVAEGYGSLPDLCREAKMCGMLRFIQGPGKTFFPKDLPKDQPDEYGRVRQQLSETVKLLRNQLFDKAKRAFSGVPDTIYSSALVSKDRIMELYKEFFYLLVNYLGEQKLEGDSVFSGKVSEYSLPAGETLEQVHRQYESLLDSSIQHLIQHTYTNSSRPVLKARQYIMENFSDPHISLEEVSGMLELSSSYFSHLFSKELGQTFSEFLNSLRIEEAARLLTTSNMKLYEIAEAVGYTSVEHFSRTFKKLTGISPGKFT